MIGINEKRAPSRYQMLNRQRTNSGAGSQSEPVIEQFTSLSEITVQHGFESKYVTVTVYTTTDFIMPQERIRAIQVSVDSVRIAFRAAESGVVKLSM